MISLKKLKRHTLMSLYAISGITVYSTQMNAQTDNAMDDEVYELGAFVVTGTNIRGAEQSTGSNVMNIGRLDIEMTAAVSTESLLKTNPLLSNFQAQFQGNGDAGGAYVPSIHGIGEGQTLVLINGHRLPGSGWLVTAADPSSIPPSAIETIDIIPDGASAIYGSDAVEGVINIVLRKDFEGSETSIKYGMADGYDSINLSGLYGNTWEGGSFMVSYEYAHNSALVGPDRSDFYSQDLTSLGGGDYRSATHYPANVSVDGTSYTSEPTDLAQYFDILPEQTRHNMMMALTQEVSDKLSVFAELYYLKRDIDQFVPPDPATVTITDSNPFFASGLPSGVEATSLTAALDLTGITGRLHNTTRTDVYSFVTGAKLKLPNDWLGSFDFTYGYSDGQRFQPMTNSANVAAAAAGTTTSTALDPFGTGTSESVIRSLYNSVNVAPDTQQGLIDLTAKFDGPITKIAGGEIKMAVGTEYRKESYESVSLSGDLDDPLVGTADLDRTADSVFAEVLFPLVGKDNEMAGIHRLSLSVAGRYDHYDDFGDTTNPKVGVTYTPVEGLDFRTSYGTSFHAPRMSDIGIGVDTRLIPLPFYLLGGYIPPSADRIPNNFVIIAGGTEGLKPEKAETWSAGFDFKPKNLEGLKISATYYDIHFKDKVDVVFAPDFYNSGDDKFYTIFPTAEEAAAILDPIPLPPGAILPETVEYIADVRRYNLGDTWSSGVDFNISYQWDLEEAKVIAGVAGNWVTKYEVMKTAGSSITDYMDTNTAPGPRGRAFLTYNKYPFSASVFLNYIDKYEDTSTGNEVDSNKTIDINFGYEFTSEGWLEGTRISLDVSNLLDEDPPFVDAATINNGDGTGIFGYDRLNANPMGRMVTISIRKTW